MHVINERNVHDAWPVAVYHLMHHGLMQSSRAGDVRRAIGPVTTEYTHPEEMVLFWGTRDANPFLHFLEGCYMLAGRNDVDFLKWLAPRMAEFSDDGMTFHGAYGYRWMKHFGFNQLQRIVTALRNRPNCRRQVLSMWDAATDLRCEGKDLPCNTHVYVSVSPEDRVDLTVSNRSNDILWGCYGADAVHFSMLLEFFHCALGKPAGTYWQMSNNWHGYEKTMENHWNIASAAGVWPSPYEEGEVEHQHFFDNPDDSMPWLMELSLLLGRQLAIKDCRFHYIRTTVAPILESYRAYRLWTDDRTNTVLFEHAIEMIDSCESSDWRKACREWLQRRKESWRRRNN